MTTRAVTWSHGGKRHERMELWSLTAEMAGTRIACDDG